MSVKNRQMTVFPRAQRGCGKGRGGGKDNKKESKLQLHSGCAGVNLARMTVEIEAQITS